MHGMNGKYAKERAGTGINVNPADLGYTATDLTITEETWHMTTAFWFSTIAGEESLGALCEPPCSG